MRLIEHAGPGASRLVAGAALLVVLLGALPAEAQEIITGEVNTATARVSGFVWRGDVNGTIQAPTAIPLPIGTPVPGLENGIDVGETLGLNTAGLGWLVDADFGAWLRHRFLVSFSGIQHGGGNAFSIPFEDPLIPPLDVFTDSRISIRDIHGAYNFLFVANSWMKAGAIGGVGYFSNKVDIVSNIFEVSEEFKSAYPVVGGNFLLASEDIISIYAEFTGFPSVSVGNYSGSQSQVQVLFLVYPIPNLGISAGYERYQLSLDDAGSGVSIDFVWDGYLLGGEYVF